MALVTGAIAAGGQEVPTWVETQARFDERLSEGPDSHLTLLRELGVA